MICILFYQAAYDRVLSAKKAAKLRHRELDSKRRRLKEELEARERQAEESAKQYHSFTRKTDEQKLQVTDKFSPDPASCQAKWTYIMNYVKESLHEQRQKLQILLYI
jgi:hypothetical protein